MTNQKPASPKSAAQSLADSIFDSPLYPFEFAKQQAISELNSKTDQLAARMRRLADNLTRRADDIASRRTTPNSLGEVQSDGVEIDRLCAQVAAAQQNAENAARTLESVRKLLASK